jgi:hypothetical protein
VRAIRREYGEAMRGALVPRIALILLLALVTAACGASARTKALRTSLVALNVARDTMRATSKAREEQIVDGCGPPSCTKEEGHARLDAWRASVNAIAAAIDDGYDAIWTAALLDDLKSAHDAGAAVTKAVGLVQSMKDPPTAPTSADGKEGVP